MKGQMLGVKGAPLLALLFAMSCQSSKPTSSSAVPSLPATRTASAANDYSKPYLTDDKMQKFLASMQEEHNPLELIFKPGGQMQNPASMNEHIDEFNSFAHKYGFQDYQDYTSVWGRITAGDNYDYEHGSYSVIPIHWDDKAETLTIGHRRGNFPGMLDHRVFHVVRVADSRGVGMTPTSMRQSSSRGKLFRFARLS